MAMPSGFLFGLLLGILIAVEFLPSFQRILESLPEHDVTSSRRLADLLDLKHIAVQLLDTVGRDSFLVVVALGRLLLGFVLSMVLNAVFGVFSSKATRQLLILGTPGGVGTDRRRATAALRSRFLGPIVVVGIAGGVRHPGGGFWHSGIGSCAWFAAAAAAFQFGKRAHGGIGDNRRSRHRR